MPLTEWRYLKALPNLGLLFNVTSRGESCRRDTCVCQAAAGRKGETSLLSCHGLDLLVSHCEPGAVVRCESHGVISSKSRAFCPALCAIIPTLLLGPLVRKKAVLCLVCGPRTSWAKSLLECSLQSQQSLHHPFSLFPHMEGRAM